MRSLVTFAASLVIAIWLQAGDAQADGVHVSDGWARASVGAGSNSAAYLTLKLEGDSTDRLTAASTPFAERAELHDHLMEDGVARMRQVEAIDLPPGETVTLEPGGLHIMLMGLTQKLEAGMTLPIALSFEKAGTIDIELPVHPISHRPGKKHHDHGHGDS